MEAIIPILIYGGLLLGFAGVALLLYLRSVDSRKRYRCPQCGEEAQVELMSASRCSTCGAALQADTEGGVR